MCKLSKLSAPEPTLVPGTSSPEGQLDSVAHPSFRNCWRKIAISRIDPCLALRLSYTPGELHDSLVLPDKPAKDAVTVAASSTGPPCTPQVTKPLLLTVIAKDGDENVQFAEDNTFMVPSL